MGLFLRDVDDSNGAHKACAGAAGIAFIIAIATGIVVFLQQSGKINILPGLGNLAYIDVGLFILIGVGLCFHSRIAAVVGLILYLGERGFMIMQFGFNPGQIVFAVIFGLAFLNGIRGAFAWHRLKEGAPSLEPVQTDAIVKAAQREAEGTPSKAGGVIKFILAVIFLVAAGAASFYLVKNQDKFNLIDWVKETVKTSSKKTTVKSKKPSKPLVAPTGPAIKLKLKSGRDFDGILVKKNGEGYWVFIEGMGDIFFSMSEVAEVSE